VFAGYGFPQAHAAGYATVAYRMAYLKTHYPAEFMAARLAVWGGFYRPNVYMSEARRLGLIVKPPHINHSNAAFTLESPRTLWMGRPGSQIDAHDDADYHCSTSLRFTPRLSHSRSAAIH
jgi:DNA polymerase III alpha subunit